MEPEIHIQQLKIHLSTAKSPALAWRIYEQMFEYAGLLSLSYHRRQPLLERQAAHACRTLAGAALDADHFLTLQYAGTAFFHGRFNLSGARGCFCYLQDIRHGVLAYFPDVRKPKAYHLTRFGDGLQGH